MVHAGNEYLFDFYKGTRNMCNVLLDNIRVEYNGNTNATTGFGYFYICNNGSIILSHIVIKSTRTHEYRTLIKIRQYQNSLISFDNIVMDKVWGYELFCFALHEYRFK